MGEEEPLIEPDPTFAAGWGIDDALAQGAMRQGSVLVLDMLEEAMGELAEADPDLGDFGALGIFPRAIRPALTFLVVEKMRAAAIVVGWKMAQPGDAMAPGCLGEELALEMIRREAVSLLEMAGAPQASASATRGVYEVCEDDDVLDLFQMEEPSDVALARFDPINIQAGKADMRIAHWFDPFYGGGRGFAPQPLYRERPASADPTGDELRVVEPAGGPSMMVPRQGEGRFRVSIRFWGDDWLELDDAERIPPRWLYYLDAESAGAARDEALELFPRGARQHPVFDGVEDISLNETDIARISVDVQRVGLTQEFKDGSTFRIIGDLSASPSPRQLEELSAHLDAAFPIVVVATLGERRVLGVTLNAENPDEAEADLFDVLEAFGDSIGMEDELLGTSSCGSGTRERSDLLGELRRWAERGI
jgi:hypothetical protein